MTDEEGQTLRVRREAGTRSRRHDTKSLTLLVAVLSLAACSGGDDASSTSEPSTSVVGEVVDDQFPSVEEVVPEQNDDGTWNFSVTMASPYDTPERYADGWRVVGTDGTEFGTHTLAHDHANEQPFTRQQSNVEIPEDVSEVTIEGRDLTNGFGGETYTVDLQTGAGV